MQRKAYPNRSPHLTHHINMTVNLISIAMFYTTQFGNTQGTNRQHPVHSMCERLLKQMEPMFAHKHRVTDEEQEHREREIFNGKYNREVRMMVREMAKMRRTLRGTCDIFDIPYKSISVQELANQVKSFEGKYNRDI